MKPGGAKITPRELFITNDRVVRNIRFIGLILPVVLALFSLLAFYGKFTTAPVVTWICWPLTAAFLTLALLQLFWKPYSRGKSMLYAYIYCALGLLLCAFVTGFPKIAFLGWVVLSVVMDIYFNPKIAAVGIASMEASIALWIILRINTISPRAALETFGSSLVAISLILLVALVWRRALLSLKALEASRAKQNLEQQRLAALINNMVDGVLAATNHLRISSYNAAALDILDVNVNLLGRPLAEFLKPIDKNNQPLNITTYLKSLKRAETRTDLRLKYADGSVVNLYLAAAPVRLGYGRDSGGYTLILRDITREKSLEEERDEFISVVSHELRTPIAIAEGNISNAQFVLKNAKSQNRTELIDKSIEEAHSQVMFLSGMINDLSTLSRAERDKLEVEITPIKVIDLLDELLDNYKPDAAKKNLKISLKHPASLPDLNSSELYVREILQNFITNAIKYTEKGGITIAAAAKPGGIEFSVSDTGIGLSKADKERVFDKFFRSEDFRTRKNNGTGLGLYVTMKLVRLLHAEIDVVSQLDHGSTFSVTFPNLEKSQTKPSK